MSKAICEAVPPRNATTNRLAPWRPGNLANSRTLDEGLQVPRALRRWCRGYRAAAPSGCGAQSSPANSRATDRCHEFVELVADHAYHLLPGLHFLRSKLGGEQAQQEELVVAAIERERPSRKVVDVVFAVVIAVAICVLLARTP